MMHHQIIFTPQDVVQIVHAICTMIGEIAAVVGALIAFFAWMKKPKEKRIAELEDHEKRIGALEESKEEFEHFFQHDADRFAKIEEETKTYQRGMLALINHSIDGNNIDELVKCRDDLTEIIYSANNN
jgi:predicted histidine transporter YuiF (NhaC family)